ncbi:DUF2207 domain-containing protein [Georgenia sp. H159]|uniref:DUF2207 domain-containing protein n=1 Tax=Georgenia sp. H159 TaxID=3076115 RepID=UPI002D79BE27|nr:DUF2207 domain-containing protein [Georgenia sp. H159]
MTRGRHLLAALALILAPLLLVPATATAAGNDVIRRLDIAIDVQADGSLQVTETYDWDFGSREGLGLTRVLDARFDYPPEPGMVRVYEYDDFAVTSPTGAPAGVWVYDQGSRVRVDVGAPDGSDDRRSGRQTYVLSYVVDGALNAVRDDPDVPDQDELYWNATGHDWDVPVEQASVTVTGPTDVVDHACYEGGQGATAQCATLTADGARLVGTSGRLDPGEGVTVMAAFPPGTFGPIEPILEPSTQTPRQREDSALAPVADAVRDNVAWLAPLGLIGPVAYGVRRVRRGRDLHYADLPPGVLPAPGSTPRVEQLSEEPAVAVRFTPPDNLRPGEVGAVDDKHASTTHVSATLIDLAVRGHLRIQEAGTGWRGRPNDWLLVATSPQAPTEQLRDYELTLLRTIFAGRRQVKMSQLRNTFAGTMRTARKQLAHGIDARRLFTKPLKPGGARRSGVAVVQTVVFGLAALHVFGGLSVTLLSATSFVLLLAVGLPVSALLIAAAVTRRASLQRTATGRALHEQSRGFELYLSTAEAHQLRFEEGEDIFSRYLPYAIVYDVAERWAGIVADLEARGAPVARPTWYVGTNGFDATGFRDLGSSLSSFSSTASTALSSTPGSSGGSGSSGGGGGFSGGGGGGGGGGGR